MNSCHKEPEIHVKAVTKSRRGFHMLKLAGSIGLAAATLGNGPLAEAQDKTVETLTVTETRNMRFCEFLVVKERGIEVYNTTGTNDCPPELWDGLDTGKLAEELGAQAVRLNGPKFWMMDSQTFSVGEKASFGGIEARWVATVDPAILQGGNAPYTIYTPKKTQRMVYAQGKPVFELVDPDGHVYVLQAHDEEFPIESLGTLGDQMNQLSMGWQYRTRVLTEDLILDLGPDKTIHAVGDEFRQYYTRIPETE